MPIMTPEAKTELELFLKRVSQTDREIASTPLVILVWGPGQEDPLYEKRMQIRNQLIIEGHAAIVSEEIPHEDSEELSPLDREYSEAVNADLVVVLATSVGSLAEALSFGHDTRIARKLWILVPRKHRYQGFAGPGPLTTLMQIQRNVDFFEEPELASCDLAKRIVERARFFRAAKYRVQRGSRFE